MKGTSYIMSELDLKKQLLINEFKNLSKGKSDEDILPLIMALSSKAKQAGISFTKEDLMYVIDQVKDNLSEQQRQLLPGLLKLMGPQ